MGLGEQFTCENLWFIQGCTSTSYDYQGHQGCEISAFKQFIQQNNLCQKRYIVVITLVTLSSCMYVENKMCAVVTLDLFICWYLLLRRLTAIALHLCLSCAALTHSTSVNCIRSFISINHFLPCLPQLHFPSIFPFNNCLCLPSALMI